jgi:ABC-type polysaccharide/polyol phosphate export permease
MNLRHFGYMLYQTTRATYLAQEKNSSLGMIWHLLNPLLMTAVLFLVFSRVQFLQGIEHYSMLIEVMLVLALYRQILMMRSQVAIEPSHDHDLMIRTCPTALWVDQAGIRRQGPTTEIIDEYRSS